MATTVELATALQPGQEEPNTKTDQQPDLGCSDNIKFPLPGPDVCFEFCEYDCHI